MARLKYRLPLAAQLRTVAPLYLPASRDPPALAKSRRGRRVAIDPGTALCGLDPRGRGAIDRRRVQRSLRCSC